MSRRHRKPAAIDDQPQSDADDSDPIAVPDVIPFPVVAESATAVTIEELEIVTAPQLTVPETPAVASEPIPIDLPPLLEITRSDRVSAGKLIARKLGLTPIAGQERAACLQDTQIRAILDVQLLADADTRIRQILGV